MEERDELFLPMVVLRVLWLLRPVPVGLLASVAAFWGGAAFWNPPAVHARLHLLAGSAPDQALAMETSGTYLDVAAGEAVGGLVLSAGGLGFLPPPRVRSVSPPSRCSPSPPGCR